MKTHFEQIANILQNPNAFGSIRMEFMDKGFTNRSNKSCREKELQIDIGEESYKCVFTYRTGSKIVKGFSLTSYKQKELSLYWNDYDGLVLDYRKITVTQDSLKIA